MKKERCNFLSLKLASAAAMFSLTYALPVFAQMTPEVPTEKHKKDLHDIVDIKINIKASFDPNAKSPEDLSRTNAQWNIHLTDNSIDQLLFKIGKQKPLTKDAFGWAAEIQIKTSIIPYILKDSTEEEINNTINAVVTQNKSLYLKQVTAGVDKALAQTPNISLLSPIQKATLRESLIAKTFSPIEAQIDNLTIATKANKAARLDKILTETSFQEVAVAITNGVVFLKVGKFHFENGLSHLADGQTLLEDVRVVNMATARGTSTASTGAVQMSWIHQLNKNQQLKLDAVLFHNRLPFISGKQYLAGVVNLSDEDFSEQDKVSRLDSKLLRAVINSEKYEAYLTVADFDGDQAFQVGGLYKLTENNIINIEYTKGREILERGASAFFIHNFTNRLQAYIGVEKLENSYNPLIAKRSNMKVSTTETVLGVKYIVWNSKLWNQDLEWSVYGEAIKINDDDDSLIPGHDDKSWRAGTELKLKFDRFQR